MCLVYLTVSYNVRVQVIQASLIFALDSVPVVTFLMLISLKHTVSNLILTILQGDFLFLNFVIFFIIILL